MLGFHTKKMIHLWFARLGLVDAPVAPRAINQHEQCSYFKGVLVRSLPFRVPSIECLLSS